MDLSPDALEKVFKALDTEKQGYITVEQFLSTFRSFHTESKPNSPRFSLGCDINELVKELDPQNNGKISLNDFKNTFESLSDNADHDVSLDESERSMDLQAINADDKSPVSDGTDDKTIDSGVNTQYSNCYELDSSNSADGNTSSYLQRENIRMSWPKHSSRVRPSSRNAFLKPGPLQLSRDSGDSPPSVSRSDVGYDVGDSLQVFREEILRMREQMQLLTSNNNEKKEQYLDRLREEKAVLAAQVSSLEERLKEADSRAHLAIETERQHLQGIITRAARDHAAEVEKLRGRLSAMELECSELRLEAVQIKADSQTSVSQARRQNESLMEAQEQIQSLQQELSNKEESFKHDLDLLRKDRDHAVSILEELKVSMSGRRTNRLDSFGTGDTALLARYEETQDIVRRLIAENKTLREKLNDAKEELLAISINEGPKLLKPTELSWAAETDNCTKEEVVELLTRARYDNEQLRVYIEKLIERIIEHQPSLLEVTSSSSISTSSR